MTGPAAGFGLAATGPDDPALALSDAGTTRRWTQAGLWSAVAGYAAFLTTRCAAEGLVLIVCRTRLEAMALFLAGIASGRPPAFFPPRHPVQDAAHFARQQVRSIDRIAPALVVVTEPAARDGLRAMLPHLAPLLLPPADPAGDWQAARAAFLARVAGTLLPEVPLFVQHSSGTTGIKQASAVGAAALRAHYAAYWQQVIRAQVTAAPRVASWLPLYHDMGLVAAFLLPLLDGAPVACLDAFDWVARPQALFDLIEAERATLCWMPNFAFRHSVRLRPFLARRDLSSVRAWINASEPCRSLDVQDFEDAFAGWGVRPGAVLAAYAMAELVFGISQSLPGARLSLAAPRSVRPGTALGVERLVAGRVAASDWPDARLVLSSGPPLPDTDLATYQDGRRLPDGAYGEFGVRSPSFVGRQDAAVASDAAPPPDGTFLTGDLGVLLAGEAFVFGRVKEIIIVAGRNLHAGDIEAAASALAGVKPGRVVAFGLDNPATGTEDLVIVAERDPAAAVPAAAVRAAITRAITGQFLATPHAVLVVDGRWLVKSTAGKISRAANRRKYLAGVGT